MATIQGIYVALFGRPADPEGLEYFDSITNSGADLSNIASLSGSEEYQSRFTGMTNIEIITTIYQSLFGRDPDAGGLNYFVDQLTSGTQNINSIAINILDGAQGTDRTLVDNKIIAADLFTAHLDTPEEIAAYVGDAAADIGRAFLSSITPSSPGVPTLADLDTIIQTLPPAGTGGAGTSSPPTFGVFTPGNDDIDDHLTVAHAYAATLGGQSPTLNAGDSLTGGNFAELHITDNTASGSLMTLPTVILDGVPTVALSTTVELGTGSNSGNMFEVNGFSGVTKFTIDSAYHGTNYIDVSTAPDLEDFSLTTTNGGVNTIIAASESIHVTNGSSLTITDNNLGTLHLANSTGNVAIHGTETQLAVDVSGVNLSNITLDSSIQSLDLETEGNAPGSNTILGINAGFMSSGLLTVIVGDHITLGTDVNNPLDLGTIHTLNAGGNNASNVLSISASNATITLGDGNNSITDNGGNAHIILGTGANAVDLNNRSGDIITVGTDGHYTGTGPDSPNLIVANAGNGFSLVFSEQVGSNPVDLGSVSAVHDIVYDAATHAGNFSYGIYNGDTYIAESHTGTLGATDTTIVEIAGEHDVTFLAGYIVVSAEIY